MPRPQVCEIDPKWLVEMAPRFFRAADPHKMSRRKRHERIEPLYDRQARRARTVRLRSRAWLLFNDADRSGVVASGCCAAAELQQCASAFCTRCAGLGGLGVQLRQL